MSPQGLVFVAHVLVLLTAGSEVIHGLHFPFGPSAGDTGHVNQSALGISVHLPTCFTYYRQAYVKIYASKKGFLSFTKSGLAFSVDKDFGAITFPIICVFCADFKPRNEHKMWSRLSTEASDLQKVQELASNYEDFGEAFTPTWVFVVTWDAMGTFDPSKLGNTLQIAVANSAGTSLVFMEYDAINWAGNYTGTDSVNTKVGFTKGDQESYYDILQSENINVVRLNISSNIGVDGQFLFRVDQETIPKAPTPCTSFSKILNNTNLTLTKSLGATGFSIKASTVTVALMAGMALAIAMVIFVRGHPPRKPSEPSSPPSTASYEQ